MWNSSILELDEAFFFRLTTDTCQLWCLVARRKWLHFPLLIILLFREFPCLIKKIPWHMSISIYRPSEPLVYSVISYQVGERYGDVIACPDIAAWVLDLLFLHSRLTFTQKICAKLLILLRIDDSPFSTMISTLSLFVHSQCSFLKYLQKIPFVLMLVSCCHTQS